MVLPATMGPGIGVWFPVTTKTRILKTVFRFLLRARGVPVESSLSTAHHVSEVKYKKCV